MIPFFGPRYHYFTHLLLTNVLLAFACGEGSRGVTPPPSDAAVAYDADASMMPLGNCGIRSLVGTSGVLLDTEVGRVTAAQRADSIVVLLKRAGSLVVATADGVEVVVHPADVESAALARRPDGLICAAWTSAVTGVTVLEHACAPHFDADASLATNDAQKIQLSEVSADRSIVWTQGASVSASAFVRTGRTLVETELFESSVSSFGDATVNAAGAVACLLSAAGLVELFQDGGSGNDLPVRSPPRSVHVDSNGPRATLCRVEVSGGRTYMLSASSTAASITRETSPGRFASQRIEVGGVLDFAVVGEDVLLVYMKAGALRLLLIRGAEVLDTAIDATSISPGAFPTGRAIDLLGRAGAVDLIVGAAGSSASPDQQARATSICQDRWPTMPLTESGPFERVDLGSIRSVRAVGAGSDGALYVAADSRLSRFFHGTLSSLGNVDQVAAMHVASPSDIWLAVGERGSLGVRHYDGSEIRDELITNGSGSPSWIQRTSDGTLFVIAGGARLYRRNGSEWESVASDSTLLDAWMFDSNRGYAVTRRAALRIGDVPAAPGGNWTSISGASDGAVWIVGDRGAAAVYRSGTWSTVNVGSSDDLLLVHAIGTSDVWIKTSTGALQHFDGSTWSTVTQDIVPNIQFLSGTAETGLLLNGGDVVARERR